MLFNKYFISASSQRIIDFRHKTYNYLRKQSDRAANVSPSISFKKLFQIEELFRADAKIRYWILESCSGLSRSSLKFCLQ